MKLQKIQDSKAMSQTLARHRPQIKTSSNNLSRATTCRRMPSRKCSNRLRNWRQREFNHQPRHLFNINNSDSNLNSHTTPAKEIAMDDTDEVVAVKMAAAAVDEVQAAAEPVTVGPDTSNP